MNFVYLTLLITGITISCSELLENTQVKSEEVSIDPKDLIPSSTDSVDISLYQIEGLPCPNSSTYAGGPWTYEEAESRKDEIYDIAITPKHFTWKNPTSGGAIHINPNDQVEVYQFTFGMFQGVSSDTAAFYSAAPKDTFVVVPVDEIWHNVQGVGFGNETSVLITSEIPLKESKVFSEVMKELFRPGIQLYYLKEKKQ